jgi:hypothetical protein
VEIKQTAQAEHRLTVALVLIVVEAEVAEDLVRAAIQVLLQELRAEKI